MGRIVRHCGSVPARSSFLGIELRALASTIPKLEPTGSASQLRCLGSFLSRRHYREHIVSDRYVAFQPSDTFDRSARIRTRHYSHPSTLSQSPLRTTEQRLYLQQRQHTFLVGVPRAPTASPHSSPYQSTQPCRYPLHPPIKPRHPILTSRQLRRPRF